MFSALATSLFWIEVKCKYLIVLFKFLCPIIMRFVNYSNEERILTIYKSQWINNLKLSNVLEVDGEVLTSLNEKWEIVVKPYEIITLKCEKR